jgi:predicted enzyme related to lactoylglutathione lyase
MPKPNTIDLIEFPAKDPEELQKVTAFFSDVFGWRFKEWGEGYQDTQDSGLAAGFNSMEPNKQTMPLTVIYTDDIDATKAKVIQAGGRVIVDTYPFPGGKRFHFTDPAGNELAVWSK